MYDREIKCEINNVKIPVGFYNHMQKLFLQRQIATEHVIKESVDEWQNIQCN